MPPGTSDQHLQCFLPRLLHTEREVQADYVNQSFDWMVLLIQAVQEIIAIPRKLPNIFDSLNFLRFSFRDIYCKLTPIHMSSTNRYMPFEEPLLSIYKHFLQKLYVIYIYVVPLAIYRSTNL